VSSAHKENILFLYQISLSRPLSWFVLAARTPQLFAQPSPSPQQVGEKKRTKGETHVLRYRQFNKATKEVLLIMLIAMNTQNKLYITQFSQCQITDLQSVPEQQS